MGKYTKTKQNILTNQTLVASGANTSASIDVRGYSFAIITLKATMNGAATADPAVTVEIITSIDNSSFDNTGVYCYVTAVTLALSAGNARQKTSNLIDLRGIDYIEVVTTNKDAGQSLTAITVDIILID